MAVCVRFTTRIHMTRIRPHTDASVWWVKPFTAQSTSQPRVGRKLRVHEGWCTARYWAVTAAAVPSAMPLSATTSGPVPQRTCDTMNR